MSQQAARSQALGVPHSKPRDLYMLSTGWERWKPYVSPDVWVSRCQIRTGSTAGTVTGLTSDPPVKTLTSAKDGMNLLTGSVSSNAPSSYSIIAATEVTGLVIE